MQIIEFKAWLEGFSEGVGEAPTPEQWAKIKAKVATITGPHLAYRDLIDNPRARTWSDELLTGRYSLDGDTSAKLHAEGRSEAMTPERGSALDRLDAVIGF